MHVASIAEREHHNLLAFKIGQKQGTFMSMGSSWLLSLLTTPRVHRGGRTLVCSFGHKAPKGECHQTMVHAQAAVVSTAP